MFELIYILSLLAVGFGFGTYLESRHYRSIRERESKLANLPALNSKDYSKDRQIERLKFVDGSCVISVDYFKKFVATLKSLIGGRVTVYETLIDRARREAVLRMKEQALGYDLIVNTRIETSPIGGEQVGKRAVMSVEVYAYGTALKYVGLASQGIETAV